VVVCHARLPLVFVRDTLVSAMQDFPFVLMGDIVVSVETAARQAAERKDLYGSQYSTYDEMRVLLVHGVLHLLGYDHEGDLEERQDMAEEEQRILAALGWSGAGLIEMADADDSSDDLELGACTCTCWHPSSSRSTSQVLDQHKPE
jgi:rRNA maturation RNase YbeY